MSGLNYRIGIQMHGSFFPIGFFNAPGVPLVDVGVDFYFTCFLPPTLPLFDLEVVRV